MLFFFVKQKTAYVMRFSYWSSDVCSSDLRGNEFGARGAAGVVPCRRRDRGPDRAAERAQEAHQPRRRCLVLCGHRTQRKRSQPDEEEGHADPLQDMRSEEHTSELKSLMRISYAVFCLKKKKSTTIKTQYSIA